MKEYARLKLWEVSLWKPLFKENLIKIIKDCSQEEYLDLLIYCYDKYSDMHPEILAEVFTSYREIYQRNIPVMDNRI